MTAPHAQLPTQASMQAVPSPPIHHPKPIPSFSSSPNSLPPPGARAPMLRRPSRFDPMETTPEGDGHKELGPRHPLRRIREDPQSPTLHERSERNDSVSLPGIKALLNAADQPPLVSPFGGSFFQSPSIKSAQSTASLLDSPTSRTSRFSSLTSSAAESQGQGWWAPEERSGSAFGGASRSSSFSARGANGEPDFKRRRSDLPPIPPDADETARIKWQAQSRNASFPAAQSPGSASGGGLRAMLYPPPAPSSHLSRGSISGTPLASPLSDSQFDPMQSARSSPMTGPLARSFADLHASERSPRSETQTPSRPLSPTSTATDRRPSLYARSASGRGGSRERVPTTSQPSAEPGQRMAQTRPPSPEPTSNGPRRSSLAELIMVKSGDNVNLGQRRSFFDSHAAESHVDRDVPPYVPRRESTESIFSSSSGTFNGRHNDEPMPSLRDRRNGAVAALTLEERRPSYGPVSEDEPEAKGDPGMRGMEVLAESARRVADAERKDSMDEDQPRAGAPGSAATSPAKATGSTGPKYPCQYCKKAFTRPSSLRIHTYSHTGERPYVCADPTCRRRFSVQSNLKRHAKVHHQNNQQPQNAAQMANAHQQRAAPAPHPMHMGRMTQPPPPGAYYAAHPHGPPPHPHMVHPSHHPPPGYGPPPPGYMGGPGPQPHPMHMGPPGHFRGGGPMRPGEGPQMPYHVDQRRRSSHDVGPGMGNGRGHAGPGGGDGEWITDEEEDELDEDEN